MVSLNVEKRFIKIMVDLVIMPTPEVHSSLQYLLDFRNYNTLMAIFLAFQLPAIARLSKSWKALPKSNINQWNKIKAVMSPLDNFQEYRKLVKTVDSPTILCNGNRIFSVPYIVFCIGCDNICVTRMNLCFIVRFVFL